jgi:hypothetical protein
MVYAGSGGSNKAILGSIVGFGLLTPTLHQPANATAQATGTNSIHLAWNRNAADSESGTRIERSRNGSSGWSVVATVPNTVTSYDDATVAAGAQYFYRMTEIYASNASSISTVVNATTYNYPRGDFNLDHAITAADISGMMNALANLDDFQSSHSLSLGDFQFLADVNGDGLINNADLQSLISLIANTDIGGSIGSTARASTTTSEADIQLTDPATRTRDLVSRSLIADPELGSSVLLQIQQTFTPLNPHSLVREQSNDDHQALTSGAFFVQTTGSATTISSNAISCSPAQYSLYVFRKYRAVANKSILTIDCRIDIDTEWN